MTIATVPLPQRIFVAGHRGMVGKAICRRLASLHGVQILTQTRDQCDLTDPRAVDDFFATARPDGVIMAAARVGGILANDRFPVEFLEENALIAIHTIHAAYRHQVKRFLFLGSTCIYPRLAPQPIAESSLLTGPLEPTNEAYAIAKIMGLKLCQYYRQQYGAMYHAAMPTNLYGPGDNYHPDHSHVIPALLRRFHEAKLQAAPSVTIWGSGTPRREFLHVDDLADAVVHLLQLADPPAWVNVGTGSDVMISELASLIAHVVEYQGQILTDPTKPDGTPRKLTDASLLHATGWRAKRQLADGLRETYAEFSAGYSADEFRQSATRDKNHHLQDGTS
jgi:GDP-L-fucose synthase